MNKTDGGGRIKHTANKKEANQKQNRQKHLHVMWSSKEVQDGTWTGNPTKIASALIKSQQSTANLAHALTKTQQWR